MASHPHTKPHWVRQHQSRISPPNYLLGATVVPSDIAPATAKASAVRMAKRVITGNPNVEAYLSEFDAVVFSPPGYPNIREAALWYMELKKMQHFQKRMSERTKTQNGLLMPLAGGKKSPLSNHQKYVHEIAPLAHTTKHDLEAVDLSQPEHKRWQQSGLDLTLSSDGNQDELLEFDLDAEVIVG